MPICHAVNLAGDVITSHRKDGLVSKQQRRPESPQATGDQSDAIAASLPKGPWEEQAGPRIIQRPKTRIATASVTVDEVQLSVHVGPTWATDTEIMAALDTVVDQLCDARQARKEVA